MSQGVFSTPRKKKRKRTPMLPRQKGEVNPHRIGEKPSFLSLAGGKKGLRGTKRKKRGVFFVEGNPVMRKCGALDGKEKPPN